MESAGELMRRRSGIVEHPFGTLKCCAGYRHFLVRGFNKGRGEWSLIALCYNFTRVLNILGFEGCSSARPGTRPAVHSVRSEGMPDTIMSQFAICRPIRTPVG